MKQFCRILSAVLVLLALCAGCASPGVQPYDLSAQRIRQDTEYQCDTIGIRVTGTEKERETCDWLQQQLEQAGFSAGNGTLERVPFQGYREQDSENLIAVCNAGKDGPLFSIVAHYDSVATSPGARDNAASVAVLLEIARFLGQEHSDFPCEIRMVFLGSEENGYYGSAAYVASLSPQDRERHLGAYNMDISAAAPEEGAVLVCNTLGGVQNGAYQEGNFLEPVDNLVSSSISRAYQTLYGKEAGGVYHMGESDQISFHNAGMDAANICWRKVINGTVYLPESYHQMSDTPDGLDYETARASGRCILEAIRSVALERA